MAPQTTIQLEGIQVSTDCKSLENVEAYKYYLMNFVKTKKAPLDTPLWPSNKWTVLQPGSRLCLWDVGNGVPCLYAASNRGNLGAHYKKMHANHCSPRLEPPPKDSPAASSPAGPSAPANTGSASETTPTSTRQQCGKQAKTSNAIAYYEEMAIKHQAAIKAGKSVKKTRFVLDNDLTLHDCEEDAEVAKEWGPPAGHFVQALMPMPMKVDGLSLSKPAVQTLMKALDPNKTCTNDACKKADMCLQNASCVLWSKFEHPGQDS
ncbi:hypothetical protein E4U36_000217 [Claviceps purpurea]|nr:hypothetical protein E4U28_007051 [Claviceps purpurea]KAG6186922.1 hypothetical protein E4U36_000217 [Claviceps purpurea]KAG6309946.1 hypothetical protein E4U44_006170 [Claviceps purpurea]